MAALLVLGPCVADAPRLLAGWYSPDSMEGGDIREFAETYGAALEMARYEGNLQEYDNMDLDDAAEAAGQMEADFWGVAVNQIRWGFATRVSVLVLLLSVVIRLYSGTFEKRRGTEASHIPGRLGLAALVAIGGFSYALLMSLATEISGSYYFVLTLFLILGITVPKNFESLKSLLVVTAASTFFYIFIGTSTYLALGDYAIPGRNLRLTQQFSLYDYVVRARITTPLYIFLSFLSESITFFIPLYFFSHFGIEGGFSTITAE
ncbi:hypothetical protein [Salinibacter ruber]|uniref:hypothetical protein n=1 Tax=Salinibacter ruber TaxID=146919 RepID=UPI00216A99C0|nr:hypothetical protein [Salinibacter ruber]